MARQWMTHDCFCNMETHVAGQVGQKKIRFSAVREILLGLNSVRNRSENGLNWCFLQAPLIP